MAEERYKQYIIPENVSDGSKWRGFRKRNLAEGAIMAGIVALFILPFHLDPTTFLSVAIILCGPFLILGVVGVMGDPFSVFARNALYWVRKRGPILFNMTPRVLKESPLEAALAEEQTKFNVGTFAEKFASKMQSSDEGRALIEGEDFEFMEDRDESEALVQRGDDAPEAVFADEIAVLPGEAMFDMTVEIPSQPASIKQAEIPDLPIGSDTLPSEEDLF